MSQNLVLSCCCEEQAITRTNVNLDLCRDIASISHNELSLRLEKMLCAILSQIQWITIHRFECTNRGFVILYTSFCTLDQYETQISRLSCQKGPYLPCVNMAGRALLVRYHRYEWYFLDFMRALGQLHIAEWWPTGQLHFYEYHIGNHFTLTSLGFKYLPGALQIWLFFIIWISKIT